ncbi:MAG: hypothetical protein WD898_01870 [Candidatus Paceibacterota bacterium]
MDELQEATVDNSEGGEEVKVSHKKKIDPAGLSLYGEDFYVYQKVQEYSDLLPSFKDWYYQKRNENPKGRTSAFLKSFNTEVVAPMGRKFHPPLYVARRWCAKWDLDLSRMGQLVTTEGRSVGQMIKTRDEGGNLVLGGVDEGHLEQGVRTLGGELLNDAIQMLSDDQQLEETIDDETLMKRRNYIINVFAHATRLVHGKAALMLKASEEKRNTAGFLMSLLAKASSGKMTPEEMSLLKSAYATKTESNPQP